MNLIFDFVARVLRAVIKLTLLAFGLVVMLGLLGIAVAGVLVALLRFVFTGRKPVAFMAFTRFRQASQQFRRGGTPGNGAGSAAQADGSGEAASVYGRMDVLDVQAYEVGTKPGWPDELDSSKCSDRPVGSPLPRIQGPKG